MSEDLPDAPSLRFVDGSTLEWNLSVKKGISRIDQASVRDFFCPRI